MIYRILCNGYGGNACFGDIGNNGKPGCPRQRLMGAYVAEAPKCPLGLTRLKVKINVNGIASC